MTTDCDQPTAYTLFKQQNPSWNGTEEEFIALLKEPQPMKIDHGVRRYAVVNNCDHNGTTFEGPLFSPLLPDDLGGWLQSAIDLGKVIPRFIPGCDYVVVDVILTDGHIQMLTPGDLISGRSGGTDLATHITAM